MSARPVVPGAEVLHADCVGKRFGDRRILTAATLTLRTGTVTGLLGRMGEGKSTLLRICAGLLEADGGWVRFAGRQHLRPRHAVLARDGLYFQADQRALVGRLSLRAHLDLVRHRFGSSADEVARVVALLQVGALLDTPSRTLSGGERRRAELAVAAARAPRCLLADEPFRGIDPLSSDLIGRAFRHLAAQGCAVAVTGHELPSLVPWLDELVWMTSGTTRPLGTPAQAWERHDFQRDYLGPAMTEAGPPVGVTRDA